MVSFANRGGDAILVVPCPLVEPSAYGHLAAFVRLAPERQRQALTLRVFDDLSFKEIAEVMACPYDTAKANYRHALLKLKDRLQNNVLLKGWTMGQQQAFSLMELGVKQMEVDG